VEGPPNNASGGDSSVYAWLIPPFNATAVGFWATLGCGTSGTITVEFDVVNDDPSEARTADVQKASLSAEAHMHGAPTATTQGRHRQHK
jgi:hypothetical protein